jgi:hypothetical protein
VDRQENGLPVSPRASYWLTRFMILRLLGWVYAAAFYSAARQLGPLIGAKGILPVGEFLDFLVRSWGSKQVAFWHYPSVFWFGHSDGALLAVSWIGFGISVLVMLGWANVPIMAVLWALYMSIVHVGQTWYAYGWETQLLETGFLAIFLCPLIDARPFSRHEPPLPTVWLFRWLIFRIMLGAGLIKLRGDVAWRDLTALYYHFETQPLPNGLSRWFHFLPHGVLKGGVVMNHLAEVVAPFFVFWPRRGRLIAGGVIVLFHVILILSGNLSFLNWLTIVPALACFDDQAWLAVMPFLRQTWEKAVAEPLMHFGMRCCVWVIVAVVIVLSYSPVMNLLSPNQVMNTSFTWFDLVNTYGAFGSVGRERLTVVFEGTDSVDLVKPEWKPYLYVAQPVDVNERPRQVAPYQPRLDWAMWFAAMDTYQEYPWTLHVVWKLLRNDPGTLSLFRSNPFPDRPPKFIRVELYRYHFARPGEAPGRWWDREDLGHWLRPLSVNTQPLREFMERAGWLEK